MDRRTWLLAALLLGISVLVWYQGSVVSEGFSLDSLMITLSETVQDLSVNTAFLAPYQSGPYQYIYFDGPSFQSKSTPTTVSFDLSNLSTSFMQNYGQPMGFGRQPNQTYIQYFGINPSLIRWDQAVLVRVGAGAYNTSNQPVPAITSITHNGQILYQGSPVAQQSVTTGATTVQLENNPSVLNIR